MARRQRYPFNGNRYIGNSNPSSMEVHDLDNENKNCQIDEIQNVVTFFPDTLEQAHRKGYDNCHYCIGDSRR